MVVAIAGFFLLPDSPLKTRWLTSEERQAAHDRIAKDTTERREGSSSVMKGLREAVADYRTWVFCESLPLLAPPSTRQHHLLIAPWPGLCDNMHLSANGFKNFLPTVVKSLGLSTTTALVLTCPPYIFAAFLSILVSWSSGRFNERTWHITLSKAVAIAGFAISMATLNTAVRYVGIMLFGVFFLMVK